MVPHTERTYQELLARAETLLAHGESVVLDASWTGAAHRASARAVAERTHSRFVPLRCVAPAEIAAARLRGRHGSISDADQNIAEAMATAMDPWPDAISVPTTGSPDDAVTVALIAGAGQVWGGRVARPVTNATRLATETA